MNKLIRDYFNNDNLLSPLLASNRPWAPSLGLTGAMKSSSINADNELIPEETVLLNNI